MKRHPLLLLTAALCLSPFAVPAGGQPDPKKKPALPAVIDSGTPSTPDKAGTPPADAVVLFNGKDLDNWENTRKESKVGWKAAKGVMEIAPRTGSIRTKDSYGYGQYHIEFRTPAEVKGKGQGRGNSGVYLMGRNEVQVLDSYDNETYPQGQCGAVYGQHIPLVNACRKPGVWQTFDIIFHPPAVDADGKLVRKGAYTVLHNGVLIHDFVEVNATKADQKGPLLLQDHGNPVQFRNLWYRPYRKPMPVKK